MLVSKLNTATGATLWAATLASTRRGYTYGVGSDSAGNVILVGEICTEGGTGPELSFGRPTGRLASLCYGLVAKFASADGAVLWERRITGVGNFYHLVVDASDDVYVGGNFRGSAVDMGAGIVATSESGGSTQSSLVLKLSGATGTTVWAQSFGSGYVREMTIAPDGSSVYAGGYNSIAATVGTNSVTGTHGGYVWKLAASDGAPQWLIDVPPLRGVRAHSDGATLSLMGSPFGGTVTLGDVTIRGRGTYDFFAAKIRASDGSGIWALDMGGDGMEYPWGFDVDSSGATYLAGLTSSSTLYAGSQSRPNPMHRANGGDGNYQLFVAKLSSAEQLPSCLSSCSAGQSPVVSSGHCYIDGACYAHGAVSPYRGQSCMACDASVSQTEWSGPLSGSCLIGGTCVADGTWQPGPPAGRGQPANPAIDQSRDARRP